MSTLRTARRMAIAERQYHAVVFDLYSVPGQFMIMRDKKPDDPNVFEGDPVGEFHRLPDNIAIVSISAPSWTKLDVTRTDDVNLDGTEEVCADTIWNPQEGDGRVNPVYRLIGFEPTGTATAAVIYLWNVEDGRTPLPNPNNKQTVANLDTIGIPPGLTVAVPINDQRNYFSVGVEDSSDDAYYYTIAVSAITGNVTVYDYAWGTGTPQWDRKKDGS
jgi:hypothetical protein